MREKERDKEREKEEGEREREYFIIRLRDASRENNPQHKQDKTRQECRQSDKYFTYRDTRSC